MPPTSLPRVDVVALVPGAVGLALSPLTVASVVFLLGHRRGYGSAVACATGWITTIAVAVVVAVLVGERLPARTGAGGAPVEALVALGAGVVLLALAVWQWSVRRLPDGSPASSRWSAAMESIGPRRAFGVGVLWFVSSPKALVLALGAGLAFGDADPAAAETVVAGALFVLVGGSTAFLPIVLAVTLGDRARRALAAMRGWIARWGSVFLVVVLVLLAVVQLATGAVGLLA